MADLSFSSKRRILHSKEFDSVFKGSQYRVGSAEFLILAIENSLPTSRIGMVIGKKNSPHAVDRNRIKRRIRESFRTTFHVVPCVDIVVVSRAGVNHLTGRKLTSLLTGLWAKLGKKISATVHV